MRPCDSPKPNSDWPLVWIGEKNGIRLTSGSILGKDCTLEWPQNSFFMHQVFKGMFQLQVKLNGQDFSHNDDSQRKSLWLVLYVVVRKKISPSVYSGMQWLMICFNACWNQFFLSIHVTGWSWNSCYSETDDRYYSTNATWPTVVSMSISDFVDTCV